MDAFLFLVVVEILGLAAWPLAKRLFSDFPDKGWAFSKTMGIFFVAWVVWILSSLKILPYSTIGSYVITIIVAFLVWGCCLGFNRSAFAEELSNVNSLFRGKDKNPFAFRVEIIFLAIFMLWNEVRSYNPQLQDLEKFMDYGFMLSSMKTEYFPPLDHFFSREPINYYYFGHYLAGFLTKLSGVLPTIAYNFQMSLIFGLAASSSFSLAAAISKGIGLEENRMKMAGYVTIFMVTITGNLHRITYIIFKTINELFGTKFDLLLLLDKDYWYPSSTRYIPNTIHEYPLYSFVVNDLHGHVSNIPNVLLLMALIFAAFSALSREFDKRYTTIWIVTFSMYIGFSYATNAWDFAIYLVLYGLTMWTFFALQTGQMKLRSYFHLSVLVRTGQGSLITLAISILCMLPFWLQLHPPAKGVARVMPGQGSAFYQLIVLWLLHLFFVLWYSNVFDRDASFSNSEIDSIKDPKKRAAKHFNLLNHRYIQILFIWGIALLIMPELFYVKDIYPNDPRSNTMFKLVYQAWIIFGIGIGPAFVYVWHQLPEISTWLSRVFKVASFCLVFSGLLYTFRAIEQGCGVRGDRKGLDGFIFLAQQKPNDAKAIQWLNANIPGQPTVVEAVGDSYTLFARVASFTGFPTIMGWPVHEWLWRGTYGEPVQPPSEWQKRVGRNDTVGGRVEAVKKFYETENIDEARKFLQEYLVDYIYVGGMEREKYPQIKEQKFTQLGDVIHEEGDVKIFKVKK